MISWIKVIKAVTWNILFEVNEMWDKASSTKKVAEELGESKLNCSTLYET